MLNREINMTANLNLDPMSSVEGLYRAVPFKDLSALHNYVLATADGKVLQATEPLSSYSGASAPIIL